MKTIVMSSYNNNLLSDNLINSLKKLSTFDITLILFDYNQTQSTLDVPMNVTEVYSYSEHINKYDPQHLINNIVGIFSPDQIILALEDLNELYVPYFGEILQYSSYTEVLNIEENKTDKSVSLSRFEYSGNVIATYQSIDKSVFSFQHSKPVTNFEYKTVHVVNQICDKMNKHIHSSHLLHNNQSSLEDAKFIIVCGYGVSNKEEISKIESYAKKVGAIVAGTKKIVDLGWLPLHLMIGQSGTIISPDICLTIGVSGAAPLLNGIKNSKTIISINKDPNARIFSYSDYGYVCDFKDFIGGDYLENN